MHRAVGHLGAMLRLQPRLDFANAAEALGAAQAGVQRGNRRQGDDPEMPAALVVHPQEPVQAKGLITPRPGGDGRQALAEQGGQLAARGRQPGLVPEQKLQPLLLPPVGFLVQQVGKAFFGFDDGDVHQGISLLIRKIIDYIIRLFYTENFLYIDGIVWLYPPA